MILRTSDFTSLCPVTGQPDFATLKIMYEPSNHIVETKSMKLWLQRWRNVGAFNEKVCASIADDFYEQVQPLWVSVTGEFHARGGLAVTATSRRVRGGRLA